MKQFYQAYIKLNGTAVSSTRYKPYFIIDGAHNEEAAICPGTVEICFEIKD